MNEMLGSDSVRLVFQVEFFTELAILGEFLGEEMENWRVGPDELVRFSFAGLFLHSIIKF